VTDDPGSSTAEPQVAPDVPAVPEPAPEPERTGVASADTAAQRLGQLDDAPLEEHVGIYEDVHRRLQEGLADLDEQ
jgi:hypothetical protein